MRNSFSFFFQVTKEAYNSLKEWFDPAFEGTPFDHEYVSLQKSEPKRSLFLGKKFFMKY